MGRRPASPKTVWRRRPRRHLPDEAVIDGHRLAHEVVERRQNSMVTLKIECAVCRHAVLVSLWEDDYDSPNRAMVELIRIGRSNFEFDCEGRLLQDVMTG